VTAADDFQSAAERIALGTERRVLATYAAFVAGSMDLDSATARMAGQVNTSNAAATTLADAYVVAAIEEVSSQPANAIGALPIDDSARLVKAMRTILTEPPKRELSRAVAKALTDLETVAENSAPVQDAEPANAEMRLSRLTHAEVFSTAQKGAVDAMTAQPLVEGWVRQFESTDPCELCLWIWREGRVWPKNHPFQIMHPGDKCVPRVVFSTNPIQTVGRKRRAR
jgi:hypothetical protein